MAYVVSPALIASVRRQPMTGPDFDDFDPDGMAGRSCTVTRVVQGEGFFKRQIGAGGKFGNVRVTVGPHPGIHGYRFVWPKQATAALPQPFMRAACLEGMRRAVSEPLHDGRQIVCVEVRVTDGSCHDRDTDDDSVERASYLAVRDALGKASLADV